MKGWPVIAIAIAALALTRLPGVACDLPQQGLPRFTAFPLRHADAAKIAKRLRMLMGDQDVSISPDETTNTVFIQACQEKLKQAKRILDRLDVGLPNYLTIIPLRHIDATMASRPLRAILTMAAFLRDDVRDIRVIVDERVNSIIIAAGEETMQRAKEILRWLDVGATVYPGPGLVPTGSWCQKISSMSSSHWL